VGTLAVTAHLTPGHTPGSTTWTWRSCEGERCLEIVYADSLTSISAPGFRYTGDATHAAVDGQFRKSIAIVEALPCDVLLTVHPGFVGIDEKLARRSAHSTVDPFVDPGACRAYAAEARRRLEARVAEEQAADGKPRP
jgi:metallo-beta-lactamase class B